MIINDNELLQEFVDFLIRSEGTYVENTKTDYFYVFGTGTSSLTEWLTMLVDAALHKDRFKSKLPGWQNFDFTAGSYDSILLRSLLNNPSFKEDLLGEFESLEDMLMEV